MINGEVGVIFMFMAICSFTVDCCILYLLFCLGYIWISVVSCCSASLSPSSGNRILIYCGEPIPCGLGEHTTRPHLLSPTASKPQQLQNGHGTLARLRRALNRTSGTTGKKAVWRSQGPWKPEFGPGGENQSEEKLGG